jgi:hypothetical protein
MPLKVSKREGSPFWQITGSIAGQRVRESSGTADRQQAELKRIDIEQALLSRRKRREDRTFADAILAYIEQGGDDRFLALINDHMGRLRLDEIDQEAIDSTAAVVFASYKRGKKIKKYTKATIVRQFYTPVAAVLHYAADLGWIPYVRVKKPKAVRPPPKWANEKWFAKFFKHASPELISRTPRTA